MLRVRRGWICQTGLDVDLIVTSVFCGSVFQNFYPGQSTPCSPCFFSGLNFGMRSLEILSTWPRYEVPLYVCVYLSRRNGVGVCVHSRTHGIFMYVMTPYLTLIADVWELWEPDSERYSEPCCCKHEPQLWIYWPQTHLHALAATQGATKRQP